MMDDGQREGPSIAHPVTTAQFSILELNERYTMTAVSASTSTSAIHPSPTPIFQHSPPAPADTPRLLLATMTSFLRFHSTCSLRRVGRERLILSSSYSSASALGRLPARMVERYLDEVAERPAYFRRCVGASRGKRASGVMPLRVPVAELLRWSLMSMWRWERQERRRSLN